MTLPNDFARFDFGDLGTFNFRLTDLGIEWPPDEKFVVTNPKGENVVVVRKSMSSLTEEEARGSDHVARGALYEVEA